MQRKIGMGSINVERLLEKTFTLENTIPANKLKEISQKKLKEMIDENHIIGLMINDEMAITMVRMKEYEELKKYVETLEQALEEALLVKELGTEHFEMPKEQFSEWDKNMNSNEYIKEWRKGMSQ